MGRVACGAGALGGMAVILLALAGCGKEGGAPKIDLATLDDNQVVLNVEGMV